MNLRLISLALLLLFHGCGENRDETRYTPGPIDTPHTPAPLDDEDLTLSEDLDLPGDELAATIVTPDGATLPEVLAAKEIRRYVYLMTGVLLPLVSADALPEGDVVVVAAEDA